MASIKQQSLTVRGRRLARELRALRDHSGLTLEQVAARVGWNRFKVSRIETGQTRPSLGDVADLLNMYGVDSTTHGSLVQLARDAGRRGWWTSYADVFTGSYAGLEDEASTISTYHVQALPGLLQSEDYAREVIVEALRGETNSVDRRLQARMARKTLLSRPNAPELKAVLAESALRQMVGGPQVMRDQLYEVLRAAKRPNVSVRVLPYAIGARAGFEGSFVVFGYADPLDPDIAYAEGVFGDVYVEGAEQVARCRVEFDRIWDAALNEEESARFIADLADEL